jgi:phospholipid/cholesterol/gamma-HCH transport system permease protein
VQQVFAFFGDMILAVVGLLKEPRTANWREVPHIMERAGADAVPIVSLINFLVGFVMAFQGAVQLKQFGANIFVADLVGLSVTRELGPLMTAIILCGRTGAAFAAELGSMQVSEEIDALRTMGFGPFRYLVLPRAFGLMLAAPLLTLLADLVGIAGGLVVALTSLNLTIGGYVNETRQAVDVWDVFSGVLKSVVFALAIALISCQQGFAAEGGAEGVGRRTTSSVVSILFALILLDAGFTIFFYKFGL